MTNAARVPGLFSKERVYYEKCKRLEAENARLREELESRRELGRIDHKRISHLEAAIEEARAPDCVMDPAWFPRPCECTVCLGWRESVRKRT